MWCPGSQSFAPPPDWSSYRTAMELLRDQTVVFAQVVKGAEPSLRVPTCPDWLLRDLVGHIGQAPRWAAGIVRTGEAAPVLDPRDEEPGPPEGWTDWLLA